MAFDILGYFLFIRRDLSGIFLLFLWILFSRTRNNLLQLRSSTCFVINETIYSARLKNAYTISFFSIISTYCIIDLFLIKKFDIIYWTCFKIASMIWNISSSVINSQFLSYSLPLSSLFCLYLYKSATICEL